MAPAASKIVPKPASVPSLPKAQAKQTAAPPSSLPSASGSEQVAQTPAPIQQPQTKPTETELASTLENRMQDAATLAMDPNLTSEPASAEKPQDADNLQPKRSGKCCSCGKEVSFPGDAVQLQKANSDTGREDQFRCYPCNNCRSRMERAMAQDGRLRQMKHLTPAERKEFMLKAQSLCGSDLTKVMTETIHWSSHTMDSVISKEHGDFQDWDVVEGQYRKSKPEVWQNIQANAQRKVDPVRGVTMLWIPKFTLEHTKTDEHSQTHSRKLESTDKIRPPKKARISDIAEQNVQQGVPVPPPPPALVSVSKGQEARLVALKKKLDTSNNEFCAKYAEAEDDNMKDNMPKKTMGLASELKVKMSDALAWASDTLAKKTAPKGQVNLMMTVSKQVMFDAKAMEDKLESILEDARTP